MTQPPYGPAGRPGPYGPGRPVPPPGQQPGRPPYPQFPQTGPQPRMGAPLPPPTPTYPAMRPVAPPFQPQPFGQPPPAWSRPAGQFPPPPKRGGNGPVVAIVLVALLLLGGGIVGVVALSGHKKKSSVAESGYGAYSTVSSTTTTSDADDTTTSASSRTTTSRTTRTTSTQSGPAPVLRTSDNPLMTKGGVLPGIACNLPGFGMTPDAQLAYYRAALVCLNQAWAPALSAAGLPADPPKLVMVVNPTTSACSTVSPYDTARYCGDDHTIYWTFPYYTQKEQLGNHPGKYLGQLAHEYGHHVQSMSGMLAAAWKQQYDIGPDTAAGLELNRRKELQATCFGGMALASFGGRGGVSRGMVDEALQDSSQRGDYPNTGRPRDHGSPQVNSTWVRWGYQKNNANACNTWVSEPRLVA